MFETASRALLPAPHAHADGSDCREFQLGRLYRGGYALDDKACRRPGRHTGSCRKGEIRKQWPQLKGSRVNCNDAEVKPGAAEALPR